MYLFRKLNRKIHQLRLKAGKKYLLRSQKVKRLENIPLPIKCMIHYHTPLVIDYLDRKNVTPGFVNSRMLVIPVTWIRTVGFAGQSKDRS